MSNAPRNRRLRGRWQIALHAAMFALACLGILILCASHFRRLREPTSNGRKLSYWLKFQQQNLPANYYTVSRASDGFDPVSDWGEHSHSFRTQSFKPVQEMVEARESIRQIGTNAIPCLLAWMRSEPPEWPVKVNKALRRSTPYLKKIPGVASLLETNRDYPCALVTLGFQELGPRASSAVPQLARMLRESRSPHVQRHALRALACIGTEGVPPIVASLDLPNCDHALAAELIGVFPDTARLATPGLIRVLHDRDMSARSEAYFALSKLNPVALDAVGLPLPTTPDSLAKADQLLHVFRTNVIWFP
jgi:hypothetical protein